VNEELHSSKKWSISNNDQIELDFLQNQILKILIFLNFYISDVRLLVWSLSERSPLRQFAAGLRAERRVRDRQTRPLLIPAKGSSGSAGRIQRFEEFFKHF